MDSRLRAGMVGTDAAQSGHGANKRNAFVGRNSSKFGVKRGQRYAFPLRQLQICGIVDRQPVGPGQS